MSTERNLKMFIHKKDLVKLREAVKEKDEEIKRLKGLLYCKKNGIRCRNQLCVACKNFMGFLDSRLLCKFLDTSPCSSFEFNGHPLPDAPAFAVTDTLNEYILRLGEQGNNGDDKSK